MSIGQNTGTSTRLIWDLPVRLFHWLLVALIVTSWYTAEVSGNMSLHLLSGQAILALILFRIVWGFIGPRYARLRTMLYSPAEIARYARAIFARHPSGYAGHNPVGGLSVLAMLLAVTVQVVSGLFATDDDFFAGPLNRFISGTSGSAVTELHEANFNVVLALIILHVAAVLYYVLIKRENLISAMLHGRKPGDRLTEQGIENSYIGRAALVLAAAAAIAYGVASMA
jgi:cytochrome b